MSLSGLEEVQGPELVQTCPTSLFGLWVGLWGPRAADEKSSPRPPPSLSPPKRSQDPEAESKAAACRCRAPGLAATGGSSSQRRASRKISHFDWGGPWEEEGSCRKCKRASDLCPSPRRGKTVAGAVAGCFSADLFCLLLRPLTSPRFTVQLDGRFFQHVGPCFIGMSESPPNPGPRR